MLSVAMWMIIGMAIVTYVPRMLPLVLFDVNNIHPKIKAMLENVPYAILGALIFPGILMVNDDIWFGIIGAVTAIVAAALGANLIVVVLISIAILTFYSFL